MKILQIDVFGYDLTYVHGEYMMSGGRGAKTQASTVVRLTTESGEFGWGEVAPLGGTYLPTFANGIRAALQELGPALIGCDATNLSNIHQIMDSLLLDQQAAKAAVDIAAWDVLGKVTNQPVSVLLGGVLNPDFGLYEAVSLDTPENMVAYVQQRYDAGIRSFQLKVGNDPLEDAARARAVAEAFGGRVRIIADSNGGWDVADAITAAKSMQGLPIYIEQPCRSMEDNVLVKKSMELPMILDECVTTLDDLFKVKYDARAVAINIKLSRVGGLTQAALLRDAAQSIGLKVSMEDTWGGDITSAAVSHLAASTRPESLFTVSFFNDWNREHVAGYEPRSVDGRGSAPSGAGLGIEVDESLLIPLASFN